MRIPFTKMQSLGNDFVIIDTITDDVCLSKKEIQDISDRHFGIGCDQVLVLEPPKAESPDVDFGYRVFNADGSEAGQCGNGVRCLAKFVKTQGITTKNQLVFSTKTTITKTIVEDNERVTAVIQGPVFEPAHIPLMAATKSLRYNLRLADGSELEIGAVSVGNPHAVVMVDSLSSTAVETLGRLIANSQYFPERANVNFMQVLDKKHIMLRVYERGSGETLACGSGACASVVVGKLWGVLESEVVVTLCGGELVTKWDELHENILITSTVALVFVGEITLKG